MLAGIESRTLGPVDTYLPLCTVPAGHRQAARCRRVHSLPGCTVAPGFDFADFTLLVDDAVLGAMLRQQRPSHAALLRP
jgi:hypothetical protein